MIKDLTGKSFGKWRVLKRAKSNKRKTMWLCSCECGSPERDVSGSNLTSGHSKSCGCASYSFEKHGMSNTRIYQIYNQMIDRCYNINNQAYKNYGNRNITICPEWKENFINFYEWAATNGYAEELTIDRIDVNGNYEPENCRWATMKEQANNRTSNVLIEIDGIIHNISEWSELSNIKQSTIHARIKIGLTGSDLIMPPHSKSRDKIKIDKKTKYKTGIQSGVKGITWNKELSKWQVRSFKNTKYLGCYENLDDAIKVKIKYDKKHKIIL